MQPSSGSETETVEEKNADACPVVEAVEEIGSRWRMTYGAVRNVSTN